MRGRRPTIERGKRVLELRCEVQGKHALARARGAFDNERMAATASEKAEYLVRKPPAQRNPAPSIGMAPGTRTRDKRGTATHGKRSRRARFSARETLLAKPPPLAELIRS